MIPRGAALPLVLTTLLVAGLSAAQGETNATDTNATAPGGPAVDYAVVIHPVEAGGAFSWDVKELSFPASAKVQLTYDHGTAAAPHNLDVFEGLPAPLATKCCLTGEAGKESISFTMPASGTLKYKCDVHPEMLGTIAVGAFSVGGAAAGGGEEHGIEHVGVHYLAYWVAVIAFAVLFIIYGLTFFLFKNGESNATTDHMDRPGAPAGDAPGNRMRAVFVVAVTVLLVVGGLALAFFNMPGQG